MLVLKFGGTSVASAENIRKVFQIVQNKFENEKQLIVVVSAFGGVTDLLIQATNEAEKGVAYKPSLEEFLSKCHEIASSLLSPQKYHSIKIELHENHNILTNLLSGVSLIQEASKKTLDYILSFGERNCAFILNAFLNQENLTSEYLDARNFIKTDDSFGAARVNFDITNKIIERHFFEYDKIGVVTGFIGSDIVSGRTTTLGRGGSDYSAAIFAGAVNAKELEIWTDVSGVLTSDPRKVHKAYPIKELSYPEAMELSHFGAKVLYYPTIRPVREKGIPTRIKNTFAPLDPGTLIHDKAEKGKALISGLSSISDISIVSIEGSGLQGVSGFANRFFSSLARGEINVIMITQASSEHSISVAIKDSETDLAIQLINSEFDFEINRGLVDPIRSTLDLSLLAVVGENMKNSPGVAGKLFQTLGKNGINIEAIAQGSSELNITFAVKGKDQIKALNTIHDSFFLSEYKTIHLFIVGIGLVGSTLLHQIEEYKEQIKKDCGIELIINGLSNTKKMLLDEDGISAKNYASLLESSDLSADILGFINGMKSLNLAHSIFIDNTASNIFPSRYLEILRSNIAISTPNKIALSSSLVDYKKIKLTAAKNNVRFCFETNVGAGLPIISTLQNLKNSGDQITKITAVLSGTLSFIFNTFNSSLTFSEVVRSAQNQGYTEPDPRDDLSGSDVARKLLILGREAGLDLEAGDLVIAPILSKKAISSADVNEFYKVLEDEKSDYEKLVKNAESCNGRLRYIASLEKGSGKIGLEVVGVESPFYSLSGSDNMVVFESRRYSDTPLVIRGPGAGANVTAAGVLSEIINIGFSL